MPMHDDENRARPGPNHKIEINESVKIPLEELHGMGLKIFNAVNNLIGELADVEIDQPLIFDGGCVTVVISEPIGSAGKKIANSELAGRSQTFTLNVDRSGVNAEINVNYYIALEGKEFKPSFCSNINFRLNELEIAVDRDNLRISDIIHATYTGYHTNRVIPRAVDICDQILSHI